jgi:hypothetical protein
MAKDSEWLFMLYLSGDNNLSSEMIWALKDIEDQGVPPGFEMTILFDALSPCCPTYVYDLSGQSKNGPQGARDIDSSTIPPLPLTRGGNAKVYQWIENSSSRDTLRKFIEWSVVQRRAEHRMLILSGHGSGAVGDFLPDDNAETGQPGSLTIPALHNALSDAQPTLQSLKGFDYRSKVLDVLGMDSCLMSMAEVCYELQDSVKYLVGSEGFVQDAGWPYGFLLKKLRGRGSIDPEPLVQYLVEDYIEYYRDYLPANVSVDMAACELATLGQPEEPDDALTLISTVKRLTGLLTPEVRKSPPDGSTPSTPNAIRDMVILAHWRAQSYKFEQYTDLWDFCHQLRQLAGTSGDQLMREISEASARVQAAIDDSVGRKDGAPGRQDFEGIEFQHSHGLSVYFPWSSEAFLETDKLAYERLGFGRASGWGDFLDAYLKNTMRELRRSEDPSRPDRTIFGRGSDDAKQKARRNAPNTGRNAPNTGRNAPNTGRNAPNTGRNAPNTGRMLELLLSLHASMKNPPQSVYLRPAPTDGYGAKGSRA